MLGRSIIVFFAVFTAGPASGMTGYEIAKKSEEMNNEGYVGQKWDSVMTLLDSTGKVSVKYQIANLLREGTGGEDKMLLRFLAPPDTKGTALLVHETSGGDDARWIYLSETRLVRQIAGASKSSSFKGSELSYEDLTPSKLDKYEYTAKGERSIDGRPCYDVEAVPRFEDSGYSKIVSCYDKEGFYVVESQFYDRAGVLLKIASSKKHKKIDGQWRAHLVEVQNVQTKRGTTLVMGRYQLQLKLSDQIFTVSQLQKQ